MKIFTVLATALLVAGCAETPRYDVRFGEALRDARLAMTIDPDAGAKADEAMGIDGRAGKEAVKRYQDSFKEPPPVVNVINIGSGMGAK
jgi:hypothetical protein